MAGRRFLYGLVLTGSLVFYGVYQEWFSWILLLSVLLFPWLSFILSLPLLLRMSAAPVAAVRVPMGSGEPIQIKLFPENLQLPFKSKIQITKPLTGETKILQPGTMLPTDHCGGIRAKLHKPYVYDFLGLFRFRLRRCSDFTCLIIPKPVMQEPPADLTRYLARSWHPKPGGGYAENHEIRQYRPGDQLNQIHWKLTAKVGELMLREPMEPDRGRLLLTMDLKGTPAELDVKLGRFLWLARWLLEQQTVFELCVLTGNGMENWILSDGSGLEKCMSELLCAPCAAEGSVRDHELIAAWQYHIGGEPGEA